MCVCICACAHTHVLSHVWPFATPWTVAHQAPSSMEFPRQEYWSWLPFPSPRDLPDLRIQPMSLVSPAVADGFFTSWATRVVHAKSLHSSLDLCNPVDCSMPGSSVHRILQARILEWVAMPSSRGSSRPRDRTHISCISCIGRWVFLPLVPPGRNT